MTPEERLAHLRDADAWTVAALKPRLAYKPRREQSLFAQLATVGLVGAVVGVLLVAGISVLNQSQQHPAVTPPAPTLNPRPRPTATEPSPGPWSSPPVQAFGGDCNAVATTAELADFMGVPAADLLATEVYDAVDPYSVVVEHNGGLTCRWAHDVEDAQTFVDVDIMPLAAFPNLDARRDCIDSYTCGFADVAGDFVFMGTVMHFGSDASPEALAAKVDDVVAGLRSNLSKSSVAVPSTWSQRPGDWDAQYPCDDFAEFVDVPDAGASSSFPALGSDGAAFGGIRGGLGATSCGVGDHMNGASVQALAAGAWIEDRVKALDGVEIVEVQGADRAYRWTRTHEEGGVDFLFAFTGTNLLVVSQDMGMEKDLLPDTAEAALAYLNK